MLRNGEPTGQDYWTLAGAVDLAAKATGSGKRKAVADFASIGQSSARLDLPAKIFGERAFIHDMVLDGMVHARVVRQPNRGAAIEAVDEQAIKRAAKAPVEFVRNGNFLAIVGNDETAVELAGAAATNHVTWQHVETPTPLQARGILAHAAPGGRPLHRRAGAGRPARARAFRSDLHARHLAHASISPSCGLALYRDGHLTVWTHCQGVFPLRAALARTLDLDASAITVHHVQGSGCYGHNGADDAAADAAIIAMKMPGMPVRVRWRREEEFVYEPKQPAMVVKVRALARRRRQAGRLDRGNLERHAQLPPRRGRQSLLGEQALPDPPPEPPPSEVPEANGGGATRNAEPLYDIARKRIIHHLVTRDRRCAPRRCAGSAPCRTSSRSNAPSTNSPSAPAKIPCLPPLDHRRPARPRRDREGRRHGRLGGRARLAARARGRGIAFARYKNRAAYAAVVVELDVEETIRLRHVWCATDAGLVVNPDGVDQSARRRDHPVGELGAQGAGPLR